MAKTQSNGVAAVVLAGGASSRMGRPKALAPFGGRPLVARVLARLEPQADALYLNARADVAAFASFGRPIVVDSPRWRGAGPLAGVEAALRRARADGFAWLATAPCDAPFLPLDLVARLRAAAGAGAAVAVVTSGPEPMFALWPIAALEGVERALEAGRASPGAALAALNAAEVDFTGQGAAFANLNTPEELAAAEAAGLLPEEDDEEASSRTV